MKNIIKAVKKLKLWSKKKRKKKKTQEPYNYPPPPRPPPPPPPQPRCRYYCCSCSSSSSSSSTHPSAPPLPSSSWLEAEHNYGTFLAPPEVGYNLNQPQPQEIGMDSSLAPMYPTPGSSYQQYMVSISEPEPVYGIPLPVPATARPMLTRERSTGQFGFGCVFSFGAYLFRCLCPCFHIRQNSLK